MKAPKSLYSNEKSERLEARLSGKQKELIQHAADLEGCSLTEFVLSTLQKAANKIIREHEIISLSAKESKRFVSTLLNPPKATTALKKAAKKYQTLMDKDDNN